MEITDAAIIDEYRSRPFELIERRLAQTHDHLASAPIDVLATAIRLSTINSICSVNTHVDAHERGTIAVWEALQDGVTDQETLADAVNQSTPTGDAHVMYYNEKARWISENLLAVDYTDLAATLRDDGIVPCQQQLVDEVDGLGNRKAAFTLANLGFTDAACIDGTIERAFGVQRGTTEGRWNSVNPFDTTVAERYYDRVEQLRAETPRASTELSPYLWQWTTWQVSRDEGFVAHDPWFLLLDELLEADIFAPLPNNTEQQSTQPTQW